MVRPPPPRSPERWSPLLVRSSLIHGRSVRESLSERSPNFEPKLRQARRDDVSPYLAVRLCHSCFQTERSGIPTSPFTDGSAVRPPRIGDSEFATPGFRIERYATLRAVPQSRPAGIINLPNPDGTLPKWRWGDIPLVFPILAVRALSGRHFLG